MVTLVNKFIIHHHQAIAHHPQVNGIVEAFSDISKCILTKMCSINRDNLDERIIVILWAYKTT